MQKRKRSLQEQIVESPKKGSTREQWKGSLMSTLKINVFECLDCGSLNFDSYTSECEKCGRSNLEVY